MAVAPDGSIPRAGTTADRYFVGWSEQPGDGQNDIDLLHADLGFARKQRTERRPKSLSKAQISSPSVFRKTLAPERCQFIFLGYCIPYYKFNFGHHFHQSHALHMIASKR